MEEFQKRLPLTARPARGRDEFIVGPSNAMAVSMIDSWQGWPGRKLVLTGPEGAGKSHLAHAWAAMSGAEIIAARALAEIDIPSLAQGCVCVEDVERIAGQSEAEASLFHLHNLVLAEGNALLLTARRAPNLWGIKLPDLASRMMGTTVVGLNPPDDALLSAILERLFAARFIRPRPDVIPYLVARMDRSFETAARVVAALDEHAMRTKSEITRAFARKVLLELDIAP